ncbi:SDR family NAD(P)-dependent oxidoreductase [Hyphomonas sp.]|uniref:SDR family NAD(P)-dependent oxidoreductase n=1 Tax=Hyphomonas sp. TaxID=87 RepID=UPI003564E45A
MKIVPGSVAFVTGAASGIGLNLSRELAARGVDVIMADIDAERVAKEAETVAAAGVRTLAIKLNVADEADWDKAAKAAAAFGSVSLLFSNAGVGGGAGKLEDYDTDVWRWTYAVNAHAHLYACRAFLGRMKASGAPAHMVVTASMVGIVPPPISCAYISSKFATLGIAMSLRNETADTNVGVSVLCPGMSATRIVETTQTVRPGAKEEGNAADTARAMSGVLAGGMPPASVAKRVLKAIEQDEFYIFTHPEWKRLVEPQFAELLAAFGESADPGYKGDDIDGLVAANGATRMNVSGDS